MKHSKILIGVTLALFLTAGGVSTTVLSDEDGPDLVGLMGNLQKFLHKAGLSIQFSNFELADFYAHEIEETLEAVGEVEEYDGFAIGQLSDAMLEPMVEKFGEALDSQSKDAALEAYATVINSCNACHQVTDHGFIKIEDRSDLNIYMQNFSN